ncbi:MAG: tRNA-dihydrouridine synthase family protein [Thermodesulfobacteriota bacterium]
MASVLRIRDLVIDPPLVLAPMAGITHSAFRRLVLELGGVGLLTSEMLSARGLPQDRPATTPALVRTPAERPLAFQVFFAAAADIGPAFEVLHRLGADAIDLNLGCPAPQVRRHGAGSRLAGDLDHARGLVRHARVCTHLPLSAKIRLGERLEEQPLADLCHMLEDEGVEMITVHARLRKEPYGRPPRWDWIGRVKSWVGVPVIGNGGIFSVEDARRCLAISGCDGLMLGRGAVVRPWLFAELAREIHGRKIPVPATDRPALYRRFVDLLEESFLPERRLGRLKEFTHYFASTYTYGHWLARAVQASRTVEEARERAAAFFASAGADEPSPGPSDHRPERHP